MVKIVCKYGCGFEDEATPYVGFFSQERITKANERDPYLPKYGVHLGVDCPKCGRHQTWLPQTDDKMLAGKFYLVDNANETNPEWSEYTASSANILKVRVKTNCPMGGDSGHGGRTEFELFDLGSTDIEVSPITNESNGGVRIILGGDTEAFTFAKCLAFAAHELTKLQDSNWEKKERNGRLPI
jgi:hypothetical protein